MNAPPAPIDTCGMKYGGRCPLPGLQPKPALDLGLSVLDAAFYGDRRSLLAAPPKPTQTTGPHKAGRAAIP